MKEIASPQGENAGLAVDAVSEIPLNLEVIGHQLTHCNGLAMIGRYNDYCVQHHSPKCESDSSLTLSVQPV